MNECTLGFNGGRVDPANGIMHLGNGYRAYNPVLKRFNYPDSLSPFRAGGLNPYVYCAGDPVNRTDPSGHMSLHAGLGIGFGIVGILGAVITGGMSILAAGSISAALAEASSISLVVGGASLVADATGIASSAMEKSNPIASAALGWVSLAMGIVSVISAGFISALPHLEANRKAILRMALECNVRYMYPSPASFHGEPGYTFLFDDIYNGNLRLNVYGHLNLRNVNSTARLRIRDSTEIYDGTLFARRIRVNYSRYRSARLVMCYSGYTPANGVSFAQQFADETGLMTQGFRGYVYVEGDSLLIRAVNHHAAQEVRLGDRGATDFNINLSLMLNRGPEPDPHIFSIIEDVYGDTWPDLYEPVDFYPSMPPPLAPI